MVEVVFDEVQHIDEVVDEVVVANETMQLIIDDDEEEVLEVQVLEI